ncbi:response regulator, partial [Candidatus Woesebacteria bacterium]
MANILIIDDQEWVLDLFSESLIDAGHNISTTDNIKSVMRNVSSFKPDLVLLNLYLKHGFNVWDVLQDIKKQDSTLPVII